MMYVKFNLNLIIFCAIFFHSSYGAVKRQRAGKLKDEKVSNVLSRSISTPKTIPLKRNSHSKSNSYQNADIYDYSLIFDSFFNNVKNYPQSTVSYYPFPIENVDYLYPKVYNRFYPYTSNIIPRSLHPSLDFPAQDDPIPFYRDAQDNEPISQVHIVKSLVPIAYSAQLVSPREAVPVGELYQPNYLTHENADILLRELENAAEQQQSNSTDSGSSLQEKVKVIAQLMIRLPAVANDVFKCLSESEHLYEIIKATSGHSGNNGDAETSST